MLRSKISMSVSAALLLGLVSVTGCGTTNNAEKSNMQTKSVRDGYDHRIGVNSVRGGTMGAQRIDKMDVSQELADRIAALPEVRTANVVLAGNNAYVAVALNDASTGIRAKSMDTYPARSSTTPHNYGPTGVMSGSGMGNMNIAPDGMNHTGAVPNSKSGMNGMSGMNNGMSDMNGRSDMNGMSDRSYHKGPAVNSSGMKHDLNTGKGTVRANETVTKEIKDKIVTEVKKHDSRIKDVYVSANPDFVERAQYYADEVRAGHPIKGFVNEFSTMIERIFPSHNY